MALEETSCLNRLPDLKRLATVLATIMCDN